MGRIQKVEVRERKEELQKQFRGSSAAARPRLKMLLLIAKGIESNTALAAKTGVNRNCIAVWKKHYAKQGLCGLLKERRGGPKQGAISKDIQAQIQERLSDPKGGFTSYKQATEWINTTFGLQMKYKTVNQYLHYHFHTKLKVGRKTHVQKAPLAEETFKKGTYRYTCSH